MPRTKVCGEYLSPASLDSLGELDVLGIIESRGHRLRTLSLAGFGLGPVRMQLPGRGGLALGRAQFDELLARAALSVGARLLTGTFVGATQSTRGVAVTYRDAAGDVRTIAARVLVGADGAWSVVAQRFGMSGTQRQGGRWAVGGHLQTASDGDDVQMYVGADGYYARNPLGGDLTNAMLVMPRPILESDADAAVERLSDGRCCFEAERLVRRVAVGPLRYRARRAMEGRVILTGDAAELLDPFLGQGIALALGLSAAAADAAARLLAGEQAADVAHQYERARAAAIRPVRFSARAVNALLRVRWLRKRAARRIETKPELADAVLATIAGAAHGGRLSTRLVWGLLG